MTAALSIDFGNSYTKVGIRRDPNDTSLALRNGGRNNFLILR